MADPTNIYSGYLKASRYSSLKSADLSRVYKRYGINLADVRKNRRTPDSALRRQAVRAVLARRGHVPKITVGTAKASQGRTL